MKFFSQLKKGLEAKLEAHFSPNVEYVFDIELSEHTKATLQEISELVINKLDLDSSVIVRIVFGYDENNEDFGFYDRETHVAFINCSVCRASYDVIETISHELFHAWQYMQSWGVNPNMSEADAHRFDENLTAKLMEKYSSSLEDDFPFNP